MAIGLQPIQGVIGFQPAQGANTSNTYTIAQAETPPPLFGDVTINRKLSPDPLEVRGMSGGSTQGKDIAGRSDSPTGACSGFYDSKPDHTINLGSKIDYLKVQVESPEDTALIIRGPGGEWCNDDLEGKNPGIAGEWLPGKYQVWIGTDDKNKYVPYTLRITGEK
nr:hypothetical protein [Calothrix sp. 336/3]